MFSAISLLNELKRRVRRGNNGKYELEYGRKAQVHYSGTGRGRGRCKSRVRRLFGRTVELENVRSKLEHRAVFRPLDNDAQFVFSVVRAIGKRQSDTCDGGGEADHQLLWVPAQSAVGRLNHQSQAWAVERGLKDAERFMSRRFRWFFNFFPAYRGTGGRVTYIGDDFHEAHVKLPMMVTPDQTVCLIKVVNIEK